MKFIHSAILATGVALCALAAPAQAITCITPSSNYSGILASADDTTPNASACIGYYTGNLLNSNNDSLVVTALGSLGFATTTSAVDAALGGKLDATKISGTTLNLGGTYSGTLYLGIHWGGGAGGGGTAFYKVDLPGSASTLTIENPNDAMTRGGGFSDAVIYGGTPAVPEPASWAMLIGGMGVVGASMRRRKTAVAFA